MEFYYVFIKRGTLTKVTGLATAQGHPIIPRVGDGMVKDGDEYFVEDVVWNLDNREIVVTVQFVKAIEN